MERKSLEEFLDELEPVWSKKSPDFCTLVLRILASLPGGEWAEKQGYEPLLIGWKEVELLRQLLERLRTPNDVEYVVMRLLPIEVEDEELIEDEEEIDGLRESEWKALFGEEAWKERKAREVAPEDFLPDWDD